MNHLNQLLDFMPGPYSVAKDSILSRLLDAFALEMEVFEEDIDRMRQTHWIRFAYRLADAQALGALMGIAPLPWERLDSFRERLLTLIEARLKGALGPVEVRRFVYQYLFGAERVMGVTLVPGIQTVTFEQAYQPPAKRPLFRPLALIENPPKRRRSGTLETRGGRVPYLYRWQESNKGLQETVVEFHITGVIGGRPAVPVIVNLSTGDLIGYAGRLAFGQTLSIRSAASGGGPAPRLASATRDGVDVTSDIFSLGGFSLGEPFKKDDLDAKPQLPTMIRGVNEWIFLAVGLFDVKGLNHFFFSIAGKELAEGSFDETSFNQALFPSGTIAKLEMEWVETEPASFEVHVPRYIVAEPATANGHVYDQVAEALQLSIQDLHAAGVRADVRFLSFSEVQTQEIHVTLPWVNVGTERGPVGSANDFSLGGRFGDSNLGGSRFE